MPIAAIEGGITIELNATTIRALQQLLQLMLEAEETQSAQAANMPISVNTPNEAQVPDKQYEPSEALRELLQVKSSSAMPDQVKAALSDIETLGRLVAPVVNREIGRWAVNERYSG